MPVASIRDKIIQISHVDYLCKPLYAGIGSILMFHRVLPPVQASLNANRYLQISPTTLENVICYLKSLNYEFLSLDELAECIQGEKIVRRRFVAFTFDDGYYDNLEYAYPIFKKYQIHRYKARLVQLRISEPQLFNGTNLAI